MTRDSDIPSGPGRAASGDDRLLELLYGEPAGDDGGDDGGDEEALRSELESYRRLRGLFRELPDEEPPADLSARILAAASEAAPAPRAGMWERLRGWLSPLVAHPALAAAASLLVVAGVAGALYLGGHGGVAEPTETPAPARAELQTRAPPAAPAAASATAATASPATRASSAAENDKDRAMREKSAAGSAFGGGAAGGGGVDQVRHRPAAHHRHRRRGGGHGARRRARPVAHHHRAAARPRPAAKKAPAPAHVRSFGAPATESEAAPRPSSGAAAPAAPAPAPPARPRARAGRAAGSGKAAAPAPAPSAQPSAPGHAGGSGALRKLYVRAVAAAKRGDCAEVRAIGARVRARSISYFENVFLHNARIRSCERPAPRPPR